MTTTSDELSGREPYSMGPAVDHIRYGDKFVQEYDTKELRDAYIEHLGPCCACGQIGSFHTASISRENLVAIWTTDRTLQSGRPELNASLDNIARCGSCERCCDMKEEELKEMRDRARMNRLRKKLTWLGIVPPEFAKCCHMDSDEAIMMENPELWEWARAWTPDMESAWYFGNRGTGKTFLARCILNALLDKGISVGELSAVKFNQIAKRRFYEWHEERKIYGQVQVLLIEDIDKAVWTPEGMSELYSLVDERYSNDRRTFVTTNATVEWCSQQWDEASRGNASLPGTIRDRLKPIRRVKLTGTTLRIGGQSEFSQ